MLHYIMLHYILLYSTMLHCMNKFTMACYTPLYYKHTFFLPLCRFFSLLHFHCLLIYPFVNVLFVHLSVYMSIYQSIYAFVCVPIHVYAAYRAKGCVLLDCSASESSGRLFANVSADTPPNSDADAFLRLKVQEGRVSRGESQHGCLYQLLLASRLLDVVLVSGKVPKKV